MHEGIKIALSIVIVVAVGVFAVNQTLEYYYKSQFLQTPCQLCQNLNPYLETCFEDVSTFYYDPVTGEKVSKEVATSGSYKNIVFNRTSFNEFIVGE